MTQHPLPDTRPASPRRPGGRVDAPAHYELRIEGHLDEHWSAWFGGLTLIRQDDGTTTLRGEVADQARLYGLLTKVRDLGATLISVNPVGALPTPPRRTRSRGAGGSSAER